MKTSISNNKPERNYGIDLLRIIAMFMVVLLHVLYSGKILAKANTPPKYYAANFIEILSYGAVDIYALISGYVCLDTKFRYKRIIPLFIEVLLYLCITTVVLVLRQPKMPDLAYIRSNIIHPMLNGYWYFSSYFGLFFFIPFLNKMIHNISRKELKLLIFTMFLLFSVLYNFTPTDKFVMNNGYSTIWLMVLYIIGGYIKKYKSFSGADKRKIYLYRYLIWMLGAYFTFVLFSVCKTFITGSTLNTYFFVKYTSPFILFSSIYLLLIFSSIKINNKVLTKIIKMLSASTFGVYLIHTNLLVPLSKLSFIAGYTPIVMVLSIFAAAAVIYLAATVIDMLRILLFKILRIDKLSEKTETLLGKLFTRLLESGSGD